MDRNEDLEATARSIIESNLYMVLGTADGSGQPWVSPVYYAAEGYTEFYWVSSPDATHSRNLAARPHIRIVVFDSQVPIDTGQGYTWPPSPRSSRGPRWIAASESSPVRHSHVAEANGSARTWRLSLFIACIEQPRRSTPSSIRTPIQSAG
jgi:hypothetical protein